MAMPAAADLVEDVWETAATALFKQTLELHGSARKVPSVGGKWNGFVEEALMRPSNVRYQHRHAQSLLQVLARLERRR
jgi:hypothetical protein